jgi:hypothetical protein
MMTQTPRAAARPRGARRQAHAAESEDRAAARAGPAARSLGTVTVYASSRRPAALRRLQISLLEASGSRCGHCGLWCRCLCVVPRAVIDRAGTAGSAKSGRLRMALLRASAAPVLLLRSSLVLMVWAAAPAGGVDIVWNSKGWPGGGPAPNAPNACPQSQNPVALLASFGVDRANAGAAYYGSGPGDFINTMGAFGMWPALPGYIGSKHAVNGGIPQRGNLTLHLAAVAASVKRYMPSSAFAGDAVLDFEAWIPDYDSNNIGRLSAYQAASQQWVRERHPGWNESRVEATARAEFNSAARQFLEGTLRLCQAMRPKASWGYWGWPNCGSSCHWDASWRGCPPSSVERNDRMDWLYAASDALYTGIYLCDDADTTGQFVPAVLSEVTRVAARHPRLPIRPYVYAQWESTGSWLKRSMLDQYLGRIVNASTHVDRVVLWGGYLDRKNHSANATNCAVFEQYFIGTLGPALAALR